MKLKASLRKKGTNISREDASAIASLVKAWESCQERIRIHRNKPLPGVLKPEKSKPIRKPKAVAPGVGVGDPSVPEIQAQTKANLTALA
jgi:hypothetical protein